MWLVCSQRCGGNLFRALFAEVDVDAGGEYLGQVPEAMDADEEDEPATMAFDVLCPICETLVSVLPGEECPNCGAALEVA